MKTLITCKAVFLILTLHALFGCDNPEEGGVNTDENLVTRIEFFENRGQEGELKTAERVYTYNNGKLVGSSQEDFSAPMGLSFSSEYTYEGERVTSITHYTNSYGGAISYKNVITYTYQNDRLTERTDTFFFNEEVSSVTTYRYTYEGEQISQIASVSTAMDGSEPAPPQTIQYAYEAGKPVEIRVYNASDNSLKEFTRYEWENGNMVAEEFFNLSSSASEYVFRYENTYTANTFSTSIPAEFVLRRPESGLLLSEDLPVTQRMVHKNGGNSERLVEYVGDEEGRIREIVETTTDYSNNMEYSSRSVLHY